MELFKAHRQWSTRPDDEKFTDLQSLYAATKAYADTARQATVPWGSLRIEAVDSDVRLVGKAGVPATLTHWAFGQMCARLHAPSDYIRSLPPTLAAQNLNHGFAHNAPEGDAQILFHANGTMLARAMTTDAYERVWNWEVAERLLGMETQGWEPARPDIRKSLGDFPALYASDHDMFVFLRNANLTVAEPGTDRAMYRGVIVENSEVGARSLRMTRFLYREMCGNHIIWGASKVVELALRHTKSIREKMSVWNAEIKKYAEESATDQEEKIAVAMKTQIAATKEELLDKLFNMRTLRLSRDTISKSYDAVRVNEDGDPRSVWGMAQGMTRYSQALPYADRRMDIDRAAGKLLEISF